MRKQCRLLWLGLVMLLSGPAAAAETVKIAVIDPLSGPFANVGERWCATRSSRSTWSMHAAACSAAPSSSSSRSTARAIRRKRSSHLKQAVDQGIRYIKQTNGSNVAGALIDAVNKHNERNPDKTVLYMNTGAVDPALTNDNCSFWHFRFDADADMKMAALTDAIAQNKKIKKVYLLNQDYAFGQAVAKAGKRDARQEAARTSRSSATSCTRSARSRTSRPTSRRSKSAEADTVITGNWGNDMTLLVRRSEGRRLHARVLYLLCGRTRYPAGARRCRHRPSEAGHAISFEHWHDGATKTVTAYKQKFKDAKDDLYFTSHVIAIEMLAKAMEQAKSTDPAKVAKALEGMKSQAAAGEVTMRADNHQLVQPLFISTYSKADGKDVKFDVERTGNGFKTDKESKVRIRLNPRLAR